MLFFRAKLIIWVPVLALYLAYITVAGSTPWYLAAIYWVIFLATALIGGVSSLRMKFLSQPFFHYFKRVLPPISNTEREALEAGDTWWEADLFQGRPDWHKLHQYPKPELKPAEQAFLDNQVETLCAMLNDWDAVQRDHDLPPAVWDYLKREKFFGMVISPTYGGLGFSALAHSSIVAKIATRSLSAAINTMVPNSLGPAELLHHYGTEQQKQYYLPRLARGEEIPCFALTSLEAGSDAGAMIDKGIVCRGMHEGKEVVGIKLNFSKRYITLAPVATVLGLAFKMYDPKGLLGGKEELGITVALLPATHPGVEIGKRHFPMGLAFMNGPISGKDVFIPMDWIIGGSERIGQGWRMLMECLSIGRSISLPALSTATGALAYRTTSAYALLRQQFKLSIGKFEGIAQQMAKIAGGTYILTAMRIMTCGAVDQGVKPAVASAIAKYHATELARSTLDHAMDIHAGRAVQAGPTNYLANAYAGVPVAITVEGANILTRNLMIFGQGATRCHPFILAEMEAVQKNQIGVFDKLLTSHIVYTASNITRALAYGLTGGKMIRTPASFLRPFYQQLTRMSTALAVVADMSMLILGGNLKRKESLSGRLGDVLSGLYIASAIIKYYVDEDMPEEDWLHVRWSVEQQLANIQQAFDAVFANFPVRWVGKLLKLVIFPWGRSYLGPSDDLSHELAEQMMTLNKVRDRMTELCYIGAPGQPVAVMEQAMEQFIATTPLRAKLHKAVKMGQVTANADMSSQIQEAAAANVLTADEAHTLQQFEQLRVKALSVDEFAADYFTQHSKG
ncbi:MAG: acyl-CoA dehydrogenase [Gammaproteobacteria bacterium]|nr:acyl-CoA dehydrogenase [Gammaproteobacteria bacterium]